MGIDSQTDTKMMKQDEGQGAEGMFSSRYRGMDITQPLLRMYGYENASGMHKNIWIELASEICSIGTANVERGTGHTCRSAVIYPHGHDGVHIQIQYSEIVEESA